MSGSLVSPAGDLKPVQNDQYNVKATGHVAKLRRDLDV